MLELVALTGAAAAAAAVAVTSRVSASRQRREATSVAAMQVTDTASAVQLAEHVAEDAYTINPAPLHAEGEIRAADRGQLLTAPLSERPCVWWHVTETESYYTWELVHDEEEGLRDLLRSRDSRAVYERVTRTRTLRDETGMVPFALDDGTAQIAVDPRNAQIRSLTVSFDRTEPVAGLDAMTVPLRVRGDQRIPADVPISRRRHEQVVPAGAYLHAYGTAESRAGQLILRSTTQRRLLLTDESPSERTERLAVQARRADTRGKAATATGGAFMGGALLDALIRLLS